jgi:adenylate kinase
MRIVLLGAPGCGKGTQGQRLSRHYKIPEISTGDLLREAVAAGTALGRAAKAVMDAGQLVSDDIVLGVIRERLARPDARKGFILDGYPRNAVQAEQLDDLLGQLGQPIDLAVLIEVDVDLIMQRLLGRRICLSCGASYNIFYALPKMDDRCDACGGRLKQRADDNEEIIGNRLRTYELQATPVIERYRDQGRLRVVRGVGDIEDVFKAVKNAIEEARPSFDSGDRSAAIRRAVVRRLLERRESDLQPQAAEPASRLANAGKASSHAKKKKAKTKAKPAAVASKTGSGRSTAKTQKPATARANSKKKTVAAKKKGAATKKATAKKKAAIKKKVSVKKKLAVKKKPAANKKAAVKKKVAVKKKAVVKKKVAVKKKPSVKKKVAANKTRVSKKPLKKGHSRKSGVPKRAVRNAAAARKAVSKKATRGASAASKKRVSRNKTGKKTTRRR